MPNNPTIIEPFAVSPKDGAKLESCGLTEFYARLNNGEYETYLDGSKRMVTMRSIRARQERLAAAGTPPRENASSRGRPRKTEATANS